MGVANWYSGKNDPEPPQPQPQLAYGVPQVGDMVAWKTEVGFAVGKLISTSNTYSVVVPQEHLEKNQKSNGAWQMLIMASSIVGKV